MLFENGEEKNKSIIIISYTKKLGEGKKYRTSGKKKRKGWAIKSSIKAKITMKYDENWDQSKSCLTRKVSNCYKKIL